MTLAKASNVAQEALTGEGVGRDIAADVANVNTDTLVGVRYGRNVKADIPNASSDTLVGVRYGRTIAADIPNVITETLIWVFPITASNVITETLVSLPDDPTYPGAQVFRVAEEVFQARDPLPHPAVVWSWTEVFTYGQVVTSFREVPQAWPRSPTVARNLNEQVVAGRPPLMPHSPIAVRTLRRMLVVSRGDMYVPESGVFASSTRTLASTARTSTPNPGDVWSRVVAGKVLSLAVVSKVARGPEPTNVHTQTLVTLTVAARTDRWPVNQHTGQLHALALAPRAPVPTESPEHVAQLHALAVQPRVEYDPHGPNDVAQYVQLSTQRRAGGAPPSVKNVGSFAAMAISRRVSVDPGDVGGWYAGSWAQTAVTIRNVLPPPRITFVDVGNARITYTMGRTVKPPADVIDPEVGRLVKNLRNLSVVYRPTETPEERLRKQRNVFSLTQSAVIIDLEFKPPPTEPEIAAGDVSLVVQQVLAQETEWEWGPVSRITATAVQQHAVVEDLDNWLDPTTAASAAFVHAAGELVVASDADDWLDPLTAASDAVVTMVAASVATVDTSFPDASMPLSDVVVSNVAMGVAVVDPSFPDGAAPQSQVQVNLVARAVVSRDNSLIGKLPASQTLLMVAIEAVVVPDASLKGIPSRPRGPRPSVSLVRR